METIDDQPACGRSGLVWFRVVVVLALVGTVIATWPLWNARNLPPMLPALPLPPLSLGLPLIVASACALIRPRAGIAAVTIIMAYGMATDQTRMQPEFFSLPILLWGTLPSPSARLLARAHLIALWFFAGFHKLLSADYLTDAGPRLVASLPAPIPERTLAFAAAGIAFFEIATAGFAVFERTRRLATWTAFLLHAGILFAFSPLTEGRNIAVWPWNVALALSGFALIAPWRGDLLSDIGVAPLVVRLGAATLFISPLGFYAGVVDAYFSHHLYSAATASATVSCPAGCRPEQDINATWYAFNVPLPPQPRLFQDAFAATCDPGDVLRIVDGHPPFWEKDRTMRLVFCPAGSLPAAHP